MTALRQKISPKQLANRWGIDARKVIAWITRGDLPAINVALDPDGRPQYRIDERDIEAFEKKRNAAPTRIARCRSTLTRKRRTVLRFKQIV